MTASAIVTMVIVQLTVIIVTLYFFIKVWETPPKTDTDEPPGKSD